MTNKVSKNATMIKAQSPWKDFEQGKQSRTLLSIASDVLFMKRLTRQTRQSTIPNRMQLKGLVQAQLDLLAKSTDSPRKTLLLANEIEGAYAQNLQINSQGGSNSALAEADIIRSPSEELENSSRVKDNVGDELERNLLDPGTRTDKDIMQTLENYGDQEVEDCSKEIEENFVKNLLRCIQVTLSEIIGQMEAIGPKKLLSVQLGAELRGLVKKASEELSTHTVTFQEIADHEDKHLTVVNAMQKFAASLLQLPPLCTKLQLHRAIFMNRTFKRDVMFAFQEINSYYTSLFIELSMSVSKSLESNQIVPLVVEDKSDITDTEESLERVEMRRKRLCLEAHHLFYGNGTRTRNPAKAIELYKEAAKAGDAEAQSSLGRIYTYGVANFVEIDRFQAKQYLELAILSAADLDASFMMGMMHVDDARRKSNPCCRDDIKASIQQAVFHFRATAERGHSEAQYELGCLHQDENFQNVIDIESSTSHANEAKRWFKVAADQQHAAAEAKYGELLLQDKSLSDALYYLQRSASQGNTRALLLLGHHFDSVENIERNVDRAVRYYREAVQLGSYEAMYALGCALRRIYIRRLDAEAANGLATDESISFTHVPMQLEILRLLLNAANGGIKDAHYELGRFRESMFIANKSEVIAFYHYHQAVVAKPPHMEAALRIAAMYYDGKGCLADKKRAHQYYSIAADANNAKALNALGLMYEEGEGCAYDFPKAADCYERAAALGNAHAHFNLGCLLQKGKGVQQDSVAAQTHFKQVRS